MSAAKKKKNKRSQSIASTSLKIKSKIEMGYINKQFQQTSLIILSQINPTRKSPYGRGPQARSVHVRPRKRKLVHRYVYIYIPGGRRRCGGLHYVFKIEKSFEDAGMYMWAVVQVVKCSNSSGPAASAWF